MPRRPRSGTADHVFHVLNRATGKRNIFNTEWDYQAFLGVLEQARNKADCRILAFCLMPNHWHLVLWPVGDKDLSSYMHWLTMTHTQRWHVFHGTKGTGPLYQGRFKSFPVEADGHFYTVCRYVERNAVRAGLVNRAQDWRWGSLWHRINIPQVSLDAWPIAFPDDWNSRVNEPHGESELTNLRRSIHRGSPFGNPGWVHQTTDRLQLQSSLRPRGRPRQTTTK